MKAEEKRKEVRCPVCNRLLFKATPGAEGEIEIQCERCKKLRYIRLHLVLNSESSYSSSVK